ncbi:MAG: hypothetical protein ACT4QC_21205 [Planctomycetaceae bacterium]
MPEGSGWQAVESEVHAPGRWHVFAVGLLFLLIGAIGFIWALYLSPDKPVWIPCLFFSVFALFGGATWAWAVGRIIAPSRIRHASLDVLPDVPQEPVIVEGSTVHGRLTHELVEDSDHWHFRPVPRLWNNSRRLLLGFGIPFMTFFAGLMGWVFHTQHNLAWPLAILCGVMATVVCGGSAGLLIGLIIRARYRELCCLTIPRNGDALELDSPEEVDPDRTDLAAGLKWVFQGQTKRRRLVIPRELLRAVQLCPWNFDMGGSGHRSSTWAVQGLLVLASLEKGVYHRLPLLLTSDFVGAARLMQVLASALDVPFLFCANAAGWKAEEIRAKKRPPLRSGGSMS